MPCPCAPYPAFAPERPLPCAPSRLTLLKISEPRRSQNSQTTVTCGTPGGTSKWSPHESEPSPPSASRASQPSTPGHHSPLSTNLPVKQLGSSTPSTPCTRKSIEYVSNQLKRSGRLPAGSTGNALLGVINYVCSTNTPDAPVLPARHQATYPAQGSNIIMGGQHQNNSVKQGPRCA